MLLKKLFTKLKRKIMNIIQKLIKLYNYKINYYIIDNSCLVIAKNYCIILSIIGQQMLKYRIIVYY